MNQRLIRAGNDLYYVHNWSPVGYLQGPRWSHGTVYMYDMYVGTTFLVIGGKGTNSIENCILSGTTRMSCTKQENFLPYEVTLPALFLTTDNYGDGC